LLPNTINLVLAFVIVLLTIVGKIFKFSEWLEKYPNIKKVAESGTTYVVLLIVAIILLTGVFQNVNAVREALNVPPPSPKAPPAPIIQIQEPTPIIVRNAPLKPDTKPPVQINSAPNGIAIGGGNVANPTVNNFGPPPAHLNYTEEVISPVQANGEGFKVMKIHVTTDRSIPGAIIGIRFSGPIETMMPGQDEPQLKGSGASQMNWGGLQNNNIPIPNSLAVAINIPAVFLPSEELIVTVKSKTDVSVLEVGPVH
jgi:hypothetical protein